MGKELSMTIVVGNDIGVGSEQKSNKDSAQKRYPAFDLDLSKLIYSAVKEILEKDEYDLLETKSKISYDYKIKLIDKKIKSLIATNVEGKEKAKQLLTTLKKLKLDNDKKIKFLNEKLR